ncbi:MAG: pyruvate kinase [Candidatus Bipolaricaulota bacterium]|nr:pyruvate kinase [Candidatus Bipolaricaulota bacterium]MDW8126883.1 pyruvate kinase [Candidatus Bipolaricaulota bacterium]
MRRTKIVATLGPSSWDLDKMAALLEAGVNVFRINTAHGTPDLHRALIARVRELAREWPVGVLLDTRGPKVRVGQLPTPVTVGSGEEVILGEGGIPLVPPEVVRVVPPGVRILLADGVLELEVVEGFGKGLRCRALRAGVIQAGKGVNFPGVVLPIPAITVEDKATLQLAREEKADYVAISFVQRREDIEEARRILGLDGPAILAKVELAAAVANMNELVATADGAMVARGDLGVEIDPYRVPLIQRKLVDLCNARAKPVIVATQMLQSMVSSPVPTRAEVADIANAVWDGADALMLSDETAVGKYPLEAVRAMAAAAQAAEEGDVPIRVPGLASDLVGEVPAAIAESACVIAQEVGAKLILCATISGWTARLVASLRPRVPVAAVTPRMSVFRKLSLVWGLQPLLIPEVGSMEELLDRALTEARQAGLAVRGDRVVFTAGLPFHQPGTTNLIRVVEV